MRGGNIPRLRRFVFQRDFQGAEWPVPDSLQKFPGNFDKSRVFPVSPSSFVKTIQFLYQLLTASLNMLVEICCSASSAASNSPTNGFSKIYYVSLPVKLFVHICSSAVAY